MPTPRHLLSASLPLAPTTTPTTTTTTDRFQSGIRLREADGASIDPQHDAPPTMPDGGWSRMASMLVEMATHHLAAGEHDEARAAVTEALALVSKIQDDDPSVRAVLEDAGTVFEDLGDEEAVRLIDLELRELSIDESPRSFQAIPSSRRR